MSDVNVLEFVDFIGTNLVPSACDHFFKITETYPMELANAWI